MAAFYQNLSRWGNALAVSYCASSDALSHLTYQQLQDRCDAFNESLEKCDRSLVAIVCRNDLPTLVAYLACLQAKNPIMLVDAGTSETQLQSLQARYAFQFLVKSDVVTSFSHVKQEYDERLALLLSTSGSTGSPKQVALSYDNVCANTQSICAYLPIQPTDTVMTTLPFNYSYGLSVINTHIACGARIVMSEYSVVDKVFWQWLENEKVSSLAGVPYTYEMLLRLGITRKELPFLRYLTQAGGKLNEKRLLTLAEYAANHEKQFFVMYGQTEACARMAYLTPEKLLAKPDSIGQPIPNGSFSLVGENGELIREPSKVGELVYTGANVMLGYAQSDSDLASFNAINSLKTGDLAYVDEQGDYFIAGRLKRFIKVFGKRISLDDVERNLQSQDVDAYVFGEDNKMQIAILLNKGLLNKGADEKQALANVLKQISTELSIHHSTIKVVAVTHLPKTANGKPDYETLKRELQTS